MKNKGSFQKFGEREYQSSKNSTGQMGERSCNKNGSQGNFRGERKRIDKSKIQCFVCQKLGNFAWECNAIKKEPQMDEAKGARQDFDDENTLLVKIIEGECSNNRLRDISNNNFGNVAEPCCNWLHKSCNQLQAEENIMVTMKEEIQCSDQWYLNFGYSTHVTRRKF